jgi:DUF177 domain-containing protein
MITDISAIKTGQIWNKGGGATFSDQIEITTNMGEGVDLKTPLTADLLLIRMKNEITAVLSNIHTTIEQSCSKCLEKFQSEVNIQEAEVHFFEEGTQSEEDYDVFLIGSRDMSIDLTEALRQEIILHFPMIPVCSDRCKGLCPGCKVNLSHGKHKKGCKQPEIAVSESSDIHRPFENLKDIIQN